MTVAGDEGDAPRRGEVPRTTTEGTESMAGTQQGSPTQRPVRLMVVEDHGVFRDALALILGRQVGLEVIAQAGTLAEARVALGEGIDAALVDLVLPDGNGADLIPELRERNPSASVLVLSASLGNDNLIRAIESGADGVLDKATDPREVAETLRRLKAGAALVPQEHIVEALRHIVRLGGGEGQERRAVERLTPREREALKELADGATGEEVAEKLGTTAEEQRALVSGVVEKLGARSGLHAIAIAARHGAVEIGRPVG